jgi:hypothetical protein
MAEQIPDHGIEYPGYFNKLTSGQLLRIATSEAKDAAARLPVAAAAYDISRDTLPDDFSVTARAAMVAMNSCVELNHPSDEVYGWSSRAYAALGPNIGDPSDAEYREALLQEVDRAVDAYTYWRPDTVA